VIGMTNKDVGRSFALVAGVAAYPGLGVAERTLAPAAEDVRKLTDYLRTQEFFDEIVVLQNDDVTIENLSFFLHQYFPGRLRAFPQSRFMFAYSGHGMTERGNGYLLNTRARSLTDRGNSLSIEVLRSMMGEVIDSGHHVLVLLNACYGGVFLKRSFGSGTVFSPRNPGAHAITAGGSQEVAWHDPRVGTGSIFFEKLFAGLDGRADILPKAGDGIVTVDELAAYLRQEIQIFTDQNQNPQVGDLSRDGSLGGFFFLNRRRMVDRGISREWNAAGAARFGSEERPPQTARIAFTSDRDGDLELYVMNADGTNQTRLTRSAGWDNGCSWSPDGSRLAFLSERDGNFEIYVMNADGTDQTRLTRDPAWNSIPSWSPDG
jgi:hypothetical protein